jgi:RsiW-degrading membrane proteinase PrsW (M82 family)
MINDPKIFSLAFVGGIIPSLLWLWFWLNEDNKKSEPKGLLTGIFILGMVAVACVLPVQKYIQAHTNSFDWQIILWALTEEVFKYLAVAVIVYRQDENGEPIDWPVHMITAALGFAALENTLFLIKPLSLGQNTIGILTGGMRFLGSTLLHAVSSGIVGIMLGLSLYKNTFVKYIYFIFGLILAVALHSVFNFFIIDSEAGNFFKVFSFLWVSTIILMLLFEKVRRLK